MELLFLVNLFQFFCFTICHLQLIYEIENSFCATITSKLSCMSTKNLKPKLPTPATCKLKANWKIFRPCKMEHVAHKFYYPNIGWILQKKFQDNLAIFWDATKTNVILKWSYHIYPIWRSWMYWMFQIKVKCNWGK